MMSNINNLDTRSPTGKHFTQTSAERHSVASPEERRYDRCQYKVVQTNQGGGSNTVKTKNTWPDNPQNPIVIMDMVTFDEVLLVGYFVVTIMATITTTYFISCPSTRPEQNAQNKLRATYSCDTNHRENLNGACTQVHTHAHFLSVVVVVIIDTHI